MRHRRRRWPPHRVEQRDVRPSTGEGEKRGHDALWINGGDGMVEWSRDRSRGWRRIASAAAPFPALLSEIEALQQCRSARVETGPPSAHLATRHFSSLSLSLSLSLYSFSPSHRAI